MGGGTYLGWTERYLPWMGEGYLPWMGGGGTYLGCERGYLPWTGEVGTYLGEGVPTLDGGGGTHLGWGYLPCTGYVTGDMPLAASHRTFLWFISMDTLKVFHIYL